MKSEKQMSQAASDFAQRWQGRGYEKGDSQVFWMELLTEVYGVENPSQFIRYEEQVKVDSTNFIDAHIPSTKVLIEQKSLGKDLRKAHQQNDRAVMEAYSFPVRNDFTESQCVAELFKLYQELTK